MRQDTHESWIRRYGHGLLRVITSTRPRWIITPSALFAAIPAAIAISIGADSERDGFRGYFTRWNWSSLILILPLTITLFRYCLQTLLPGAGGGPLVSLFKENQTADAEQALRRQLMDGYNAALSLFLMVLLHIADLQNLMVAYWSRWLDPTSSVVVNEKDWSVMFLIGTSGFPGEHWMGMATNLALVFAAYSVQFCAGFIAVTMLVILFRHNLFFVCHIYQRRRGQSLCIHVNVDDSDEKVFGFAKANPAFNLQVGLATLTGILLLASRFANTSIKPPSSISIRKPLESAEAIMRSAKISGTISDPGQWILVVLWLVMLAIVSVPALIKFLPLLSWRGINLTRSEYLREFIPESQWPRDKNVNELSKRFAENSFWPTGDGKAKWLFTAAFFVLLLLIYPLPLAADLTTLEVYGIIVSIAFLANAAVFWLLTNILGFVGISASGRRD